ncbi:SWR1-complex protein 4 [Cryptococcus tetragattii IND107]|uniref:SWR1-complex protein 4 n=1 Tax=Cryptococcus tetragattii IND107 TaxID=1296105 RepID=A0ABR3BSG2_9TREE|nr:SWR1-complex protein 4 [Cryptococcus tetragattii IND107]
MSAQDVRSILSLPPSAPIPTLPSSRKIPAPRKPDGITRELYALIGDNAPSLADAQASLAAVKYREKPAMKGKKVHWEWTEFTPAARSDNPVRLRHWACITDSDPNASVEYFGKFSLHGPSVMEYSQFEYDQHLVDPNWTPQETEYLFELLKEYDLRFIIAADRYAYISPEGEKRVRSVEDMKDRYYTICRRLIRTRTASDPVHQQHLIQAYAFDKARETKRKQYASDLFHLTPAEIAEEEALYVEITRMQQNERRFRADRDELMRSVMGLDSGLMEVDQAAMENAIGVDKNKKKRKAEDESAAPSPAPTPKKPTPNASFDNSRCIYHLPAPSNTNSLTSHLSQKHPPHQQAFLRGSRLPLPKPTAAGRITDLLAELGLSANRLVMPTRQNLEVFEGLLNAAAALVEMRRQVNRVEQELRVVRMQKEGLMPVTTNPSARVKGEAGVAVGGSEGVVKLGTHMKES